MYKNYTGDFNGSFAQRPYVNEQSLKSTVHNHINQSDTHSGVSKVAHTIRKLRTADSGDEEIEYIENNRDDGDYFELEKKKTSSDNPSSVGSLNNQ